MELRTKTTRYNVVGWTPRPPFFYGWLMLGTAAVGSGIVGTGVANIVLAGVQNLIFEDMGWNRSTIAFAVTAGTWASGVLTLFVGRLVDKFGPRGIMPIASLVVGVCFLLLSGIQSVWQFYAAYIVARAISNPALLGLVPRTAVVNFFKRKRSLALGLFSMAPPVGGAINVQIISLMAQVYSWRVAYRFLGIFALIFAIPLALIMRRKPEDIGLHPDENQRYLDCETGPDAGPCQGVLSSTEAEEGSWSLREATHTSTYWLIVTTHLIVLLTWGAVGFQVVPYLKDSGISQTMAAGAWSLGTLIGAVANPFWGYLSDRFSTRRLALVALTTTAGATSLFLVTGESSQSFFVVILWGASSGGLTILNNMMLAEYFGRTSFGSIAGLMASLETTSVGLGPALGAVIYGLAGGYPWLFRCALATYILAFILIYSVRTPTLPCKDVAFPQGQHGITISGLDKPYPSGSRRHCEPDS